MALAAVSCKRRWILPFVLGPGRLQSILPGAWQGNCGGGMQVALLSPSALVSARREWVWAPRDAGPKLMIALNSYQHRKRGRSPLTDPKQHWHGESQVRRNLRFHPLTKTNKNPGRIWVITDGQLPLKDHAKYPATHLGLRTVPKTVPIEIISLPRYVQNTSDS